VIDDALRGADDAPRHRSIAGGDVDARAIERDAGGAQVVSTVGFSEVFSAMATLGPSCVPAGSHVSA
jgi:hypothetical protein